jgi:N-acetylneuraminic acid mutarotase
VLEDYEYLPQNISLTAFAIVKGNLYSFGGIKKEMDGRSTYCIKVYKFNWKLLTW